jgi:potassium uptake TrkH family protein
LEITEKIPIFVTGNFPDFMMRFSKLTSRRHSLYYEKYVAPHVIGLLKVLSFLAAVGALCMIVGAVLEMGFDLTDRLRQELNWVYFWVWLTFLVERISRLILLKRRRIQSVYSLMGWCVNGLLTLTLIPIFVNFFGIDDSFGIMKVLDNRVFHLLVLFLISSIQLSSTVIGSMGRKASPPLMMAVSFLFIILVGSGMLLMPHCIQPGVHLSWIDSLFTATSAVCVTGLTTIDVPNTFTSLGQLVVMMLIQIGGLGVMTITSFFALFFMGNTSIYNQMVVRDMVSSKSLGSLWSTLLHIFGFTALIELGGAVAIFIDIHGVIGLDLSHELFFSVFHSVSAFCNGGFSIYRDGLSAPILMTGHSWLYIIIAFLIILGGIGYPVLVNLKAIVWKYVQAIWDGLNGRGYTSLKFHNLLDLNTKIVLRTTALLIVIGTVLLCVFEWDNTFAGMPLHEKLTQAFFNAVSPRTAGFISVNLNSMCIQSISIYLILMWIGGASQSTAGGVKVNAFAVAWLNIRAVLHGTTRVEFAGRELSQDSIRRANATIFVSLCVLACFIFSVTLFEPNLPLKAIVFECVSAFATVGSSLGITSQLSDISKLLIIVLMFIGRVGVVTLAQGLLKQYKNQYYQLPQDNIIIS